MYISIDPSRDSLPDPQAFSTRSMSELSSIMSAASKKTILQNSYDETLIDKSKKRLKNKAEVMKQPYSKLHANNMLRTYFQITIFYHPMKTINCIIFYQVRYISLKPLDKKEKKRQEKIQAMRRMVKHAVSDAGTSLSNEGTYQMTI